MWEKLPMDPIFSVHNQYMQDPRPDKINAALGVLLQNQQEYVMPSVQFAATKVRHDNYGYLPMKGDLKFLEWARDFYISSKQNNNIALQQTAGGTHACWMMGQLGIQCNFGPFLIPTPTWENYFALLKNQKQILFDHLNNDGEINWNVYLDILNSAQEGSVLLLQATGAHNPTGKNLSFQQRKELIKIVNKRKIWVYMDGAYIGLADGLKIDKSWINEMWQEINQVMLGISFSKTATLYGHRLGALMIKCSNENNAKAMESYMQTIMRENISVPPCWGNRIMEQLDITKWETDITHSQEKLFQTRTTLQKILKNSHAPDTWINALNGTGLFVLLPIKSQLVKQLAQKYGIYVAQNGRINISGFIGKEELITHFLEK